MVEQLAPQGWSPVDNIPSLNLVSVFSAAPQLMSLNLLPSPSFTIVEPPILRPFPPHVRSTNSIPPKTKQKSDSKNGDDEKKKEEYHDLNTG